LNKPVNWNLEVGWCVLVSCEEDVTLRYVMCVMNCGIV